MCRCKGTLKEVAEGRSGRGRGYKDKAGGGRGRVVMRSRDSSTNSITFYNVALLFRKL